MENIAEALKMAFGVIIALLLVSLLIYSFNMINQTENTKTDLKVQEEVIEFNKKFIAFQKTSMYGTDLISILSLAITTNETYNVEYSSDENDGKYYEERDGTINIKFKLKSDVKAITTYWTREPIIVDGKYHREWREDKPATRDTILNANMEYNLQNGLSLDKIKKIAVEGNSNIIVETKGMKKKEMDTSGFNDFKTRIFECTDVKSRPTGRIYSMTFVEKDV